MNRFEKLDLAMALLKTKMSDDLAYASMVGYLSAMVDDKRADAVLELVQQKVAEK
jgi:hypothetical protein